MNFNLFLLLTQMVLVFLFEAETSIVKHSIKPVIANNYMIHVFLFYTILLV